MLQMTT